MIASSAAAPKSIFCGSEFFLKCDGIPDRNAGEVTITRSVVACIRDKQLQIQVERTFRQVMVSFIYEGGSLLGRFTSSFGYVANDVKNDAKFVQNPKAENNQQQLIAYLTKILKGKTTLELMADYRESIFELDRAKKVKKWRITGFHKDVIDGIMRQLIHSNHFSLALQGKNLELYLDGGRKVKHLLGTFKYAGIVSRVNASRLDSLSESKRTSITEMMQYFSVKMLSGDCVDELIRDIEISKNALSAKMAHQLLAPTWGKYGVYSMHNALTTVQVHKIHRSNCEAAKGIVVVIDVIRAFTTAAFAFAKGAEKIILVKDVEQAFHLKRINPEYLLMGEQGGGYPVEGFNYSNSPAQLNALEKDELKGKTLVHRTSSGTQGVVGCAHMDQMFIASFAVANATLKSLQKLKPKEVTFVITGQTFGGCEDRALADYLGELLLEEDVDPQLYLKRVLDSPSAVNAREVLTDNRCLAGDLEHVVALDKFPFAMEVRKENGLQVAYPVYV